ncbi:hypothetical protein F4780DRAFT_515758 [Xylariomycetidae sp. FL0641]|nr:hypothetical protein F4780DRAFT_515758 [Xylariomycetidae sp. FL0641]
MSGRSAYVRKKITEQKTGNPGGLLPTRGRAKSSGSSRHSECEDGSIPDFSIPQSTGYATSNGRFLKFSDPTREPELVNYATEPPSFGVSGSNGSQCGTGSGGSDTGKRDSNSPQGRGPMPDFAYARARKPVIRTEDVSGIERSGFRSAVDKRSDELRKGLSKAFTFGNKKKKGVEVNVRSGSSATIRPYHVNETDRDRYESLDRYDYDNYGNYDNYDNCDNDRYDRRGRHDAHDGLGNGEMGDPTVLTMPAFQSPRSPPSGVGVGESDFQPMMSPPPSSKLPPIPSPSTTLPVKRWVGAGKPVQRWNKLRKDPELWDPNGDVLVFFGSKGQLQRPNPSFRLSSHIIEATESRFLIALLREGSTEDDCDYEYDAHISPSPVGAPPMLRHGSHLSPSDIGPPGHPRPTYLHGHGYGHGYGYDQGYGHARGGHGQPTPPISEDTSLADADGQISYEMYFPTPPNLTRIEAHRHAITTRNVFALLYHASLVGLSLYQALSDLLTRLEMYMPPEADNVGTVLNYLSARGIDDARNDVETAVSMLAWSESPEVRWEEGWREAFLHCVGMYSRLEPCADYKSLTPITRAFLERACLEVQLRVQAAEDRLADFSYDDIWSAATSTSSSSSSPATVAATTTAAPSMRTARGSADRLKQFFVNYYTRTYGNWPPPSPDTAATTSEGEQMWLTRTMAKKLQKDFGALYDYLVNRDVVWDESETRSSRKWMMVSVSGNKSFHADTIDLPLTDMLIEFDNRMRFPHIPHPYPLVPESIPPVTSPHSTLPPNSSRRDRDKTSKDRPARSGTDDRMLDRRVQLAYTEATNIYILGSDFAHSDLIEEFVKFEKTDQIGSIDPFCARRGRWVLIYCILQTLASVSVDSPNVRYKENVTYHLSPRLKGTKTPPWKGVSSPTLEASHELSHCWLVPRTWISGTEGTESDNSSTAADPLLRMMRAHAARTFPRATPQHQQQQSQPFGPRYTDTRNMHSTRPNGAIMKWTAPTMSSSSVYSDDNTTTVSTPITTSSHHHFPPPPPPRSYRSTASKSERSYATFGRHGGEGSVAGGGEAEIQATDNPQWPARTHSIPRVKPLVIPGSVTGTGDFIDLEHSPLRSGRPDGYEEDGGLGALIRDFDELDSVAEEQVYVQDRR